MKTHTLAEFVAKLADPMSLLEGGHSTAGQLRTLAKSLEGFRDIAVSDLAAFLDTANSALKSGQVRLDTPQVVSLRDRLEALDSALHSDAGEDELKTAQEEFATIARTTAAEYGITFGAPKYDAKWLTNQMADREAAPVVESIRRLASSITKAEQFDDPTFQTAIGEIAAAELAILKHAVLKIGGDLGTAKKPLDPAGMVLSALARLNQLVPSQVPSATSKKKPKEASAEVVQNTIEELLELVQISTDPKALSQARIDKAMADFESKSFSATQKGDIAFKVSGVKTGAKPKKAADAIFSKLTATRRAAETQTW